MENNARETIRIDMDQSVAVIRLNRPEKHNAFNHQMLHELVSVFDEINGRTDIRVVIVTGEGPSFSAGADLNWMQEMVHYDYEENLANARLIARIFYKIYHLNQPVITAVNGAIIGGGMGFVGASDIVIASDRALFGFTEIRLGIIPACISTYLLRKVGEGVLKELFLTGRRFTPEEALEKRLVNHVVAHDRLMTFTREVAEKLLRCGPNALSKCKELFRKIPELPMEEANECAAEMLARLRITDEAQEGMHAFLNKRKPNWVPDNPK